MQSSMLHRMRPARTLVFVGLLLALSLLIPPPAQIGAQGNQKPASKLSSRLRVMAYPAASLGFADDAARARALNLPAEGPGSVSTNNDGDLLVYIRTTDTTTPTLELLADAGVEIVHVSEEYSTVTAFVPPAQLTAVAKIAEVISIREGLQPYVPDSPSLTGANLLAPARTDPPDCRPLAISEGLVQLKVDEVHSTFGLDGAGITIGVLSDSFNSFDPLFGPPTTTVDMNIGSGNLPGPGNPCGHLTPVTVLREGKMQSDEGRAMLQIVHDLAPAANLAFASAFYGIFDFADQIRNLRAVAGADIIVDDVYYFMDPYFQDGPISQAIAEVTASGAIYFTLAGNHHYELNGHAIGSYESPAFRPIPCPANLNVVGDCHDFDPGGGIDNTAGFTLEKDGVLALNLQWAEPWDGVETDLDVYLIDAAGAILGWPAREDNFETQVPHEYLYYENYTGGVQDVQVVIHRYAGTATPRLKYILIQETYGIKDAEYTQGAGGDIMGPTVYGHSGAAEAISVGAIEYNQLDTPQSFTSWGYPVYYFEPVTESGAGAPLPEPEIRHKPDIVATNGGCTTFFGPYNSAAGCYRFYGTSAAAPHAAAVGALVLQRARQLGLELDHRQLETLLETSARPIPNAPAEAVGAGLIDALAAVNSVMALPNLVLSQSSPTRIARPGDVISYTITVKNNGSATATDVAVVSAIPPGATYIEGSAGSAATLDGSTLRWEVGDLAVEKVLTLTFQLTADDALEHGAVITSVTQVTSAEGVSDTVATPIGIYVDGVQVSLTASAGTEPVDPGAVVSYTLVVANYTNEVLENVVISSTQPDALRYIEGSSTISISPIAYDFETGPQGWSTGSEDGNPPMNWELGPPALTPSATLSKCQTNCFGRGAHQDHTPGFGTSAWATDLDDRYSNYIERGIELYSPVFDFSGRSDVLLIYWEWLEVENGDYDEARLEYRVGDAPWTTAWSSAGSEPRVDYSWSQTSYRADYADGQSEVQWRWRLTTDDVFQFGGWYIDDVYITFAEADLPRPANAPPSLVTADDRYTLAPNQSLTLTFAATVEPAGAEVAELTHTVEVSADGRLIAAPSSVLLVRNTQP